MRSTRLSDRLPLHFVREGNRIRRPQCFCTTIAQYAIAPLRRPNVVATYEVAMASSTGIPAGVPDRDSVHRGPATGTVPLGDRVSSTGQLTQTCRRGRGVGSVPNGGLAVHNFVHKFSRNGPYGAKLHGLQNVKRPGQKRSSALGGPPGSHLKAPTWPARSRCEDLGSMVIAACCSTTHYLLLDDLP
jgi:hypothetical protein